MDQRQPPPQLLLPQLLQPEAAGAHPPQLLPHDDVAHPPQAGL